MTGDLTDNVVALKGGPVDRPNVPDPEVIRHLEELLAQARAGDINGIAFVTRSSNKSDPMFGRSGWTDAAMLGACVALTEMVRAVIFDDADE